MADVSKQIEALRKEIEDLKRGLRDKAQANPFEQDPTRLTDQAQPPPIKGVDLIPNLNTITIVFDPVRIRDLRNYEIQTSESPDMFDPTVYQSVAPRFTLQEVTPESDFYFRARAINNGGVKGDWTRIFSTAPKPVQTVHIDVNAATSLAAMRRTRGGFYFNVIDTGDGTGILGFEAGGLTVVFDEQADVEIAATYSFYLVPYKARCRVATSLKFDGTEFNEGVFTSDATDDFSFQTGTIQAQIASVAAGNHRASVEFSLDPDGTDTPLDHTVFQADRLSLQVIRSKR